MQMIRNLIQYHRRQKNRGKQRKGKRNEHIYQQKYMFYEYVLLYACM